MKFLKNFDPFRKPQAESMAVEMLEEAKRQLLVAQDAVEYAQAQVDRHTKGIARLTAIINTKAIK